MRASTHARTYERGNGADAKVRGGRDEDREANVLRYDLSRLRKRFCQLYVATGVHSRIARALQSASAPSFLPLPLSFAIHPPQSYLQSQPPRRDCVFRGACRLSPFKTLTPNAERVSPRVNGEEGGFSIEISEEGMRRGKRRKSGTFTRLRKMPSWKRLGRPLCHDCSEKLWSTVDYFNSIIMKNILRIYAYTVYN